MRRAVLSFFIAWMIAFLAVGSVAAQMFTPIPDPPTSLLLFRFLADHVVG